MCNQLWCMRWPKPTDSPVFTFLSLHALIAKQSQIWQTLNSILRKGYVLSTRGNIMQNRPAIVAVGRTKFGEHYGKEPEKLIEEAWLAASRESNLERRDLEACYMSDCLLPITNKLGLEEGFLSELTELHVPMEVTRSVSAAFLTACNGIASGVYSTVLVGGIEKMTGRWDKMRDGLLLCED